MVCRSVAKADGGGLAMTARSGAKPRGLSLCVFTGAATQSVPEVVELARSLGEHIARRGHRLVYGGGAVGLMGLTAHASAEHGGEVLGVVPQTLYELERGYAAPAQELLVTSDLFERKRLMIGLSDAFLALPGGFGTLDELLEVVSMHYLGYHSKPIVLVNDTAFWDPFLALISSLRDGGYLGNVKDPAFHVTSTVADALDLVEAHCRTPGDAWRPPVRGDSEASAVPG